MGTGHYSWLSLPTDTPLPNPQSTVMLSSPQHPYRFQHRSVNIHYFPWFFTTKVTQEEWKLNASCNLQLHTSPHKPSSRQTVQHMLTCSSATSKGWVDSSPTEGRRALPTEGCLLDGWDEASPNEGYRGYPLGKFWAANPGAEFLFGYWLKKKSRRQRQGRENENK